MARDADPTTTMVVRQRRCRRRSTASRALAGNPQQVPARSATLVRSRVVNALGMRTPAPDPSVDDRFDAIFRQHYARLARVIGRIVHDRSRAEEIAVDVFLSWRRHPAAQGDGAEGWLYRTAVRAALDAWRREQRWGKVQRLLSWVTGATVSPDAQHAAAVTRANVRATLARMKRRDALALLLWSEDATYAEIAAAVGVKTSSVGSLLARAQAAFRKDFEARHGTHS